MNAYIHTLCMCVFAFIMYVYVYMNYGSCLISCALMNPSARILCVHKFCAPSDTSPYKYINTHPYIYVSNSL